MNKNILLEGLTFGAVIKMPLNPHPILGYLIGVLAPLLPVWLSTYLRPGRQQVMTQIPDALSPM